MARRLFWAAVWLAVALVGIKASHLPLPRAGRSFDYLNSLTAITYRDVVYVCVFWTAARAGLLLARGRPLIARTLAIAFLSACVLTIVYGIASMVAFLPLGGFPTYPLLQLVGSLRMISSSVTAFITPGVVASLLLVPAAFLSLTLLSGRLANWSARARTTGLACLFAATALWVANGYYVFATDWKTHWDWRAAENAPWVLASSAWKTSSSTPTARLSTGFGLGDLSDFSPIGVQPAPRSTARRRPPNVVIVVLESVAAR